MSSKRTQKKWRARQQERAREREKLGREHTQRLTEDRKQRRIDLLASVTSYDLLESVQEAQPPAAAPEPNLEPGTEPRRRRGSALPQGVGRLRRAVDVDALTPDQLFDHAMNGPTEDPESPDPDLHERRVRSDVRQLIQGLEQAGLSFEVGEAQKVEIAIGDQFWSVWLQVDLLDSDVNVI